MVYCNNLHYSLQMISHKVYYSHIIIINNNYIIYLSFFMYFYCCVSSIMAILKVSKIFMSVYK